MKTDPICLDGLRFDPQSAMDTINKTFETLGLGVHLKIIPYEGEDKHDSLRRIEVTRMDDDLNEPLGTPACNLGEACESCQ